MFIDSGRILGVLGKKPPLMTTREELKVDKARDEWKKLIAQGWRRNKFGKTISIQYCYQDQLYKL